MGQKGAYKSLLGHNKPDNLHKNQHYHPSFHLQDSLGLYLSIVASLSQFNTAIQLYKHTLLEMTLLKW